MPFDAAKLAADTEAFCQELRPHEELCYVEHRFNDQLAPLAKKHDLLGINVCIPSRRWRSIFSF